MTVSLVPNGATQGTEAFGIPGVESSIWTERMVLAGQSTASKEGLRSNRLRLDGKWFSLMDKVYAPKTLRLAWERVQANRGAAGVDGESVARFAAQADQYWTELNQDLKAGRYQPDAVKRVEIPKGDGTTRPLGIPTVKDRIVQTAVKMVIEPIYEVQLVATSYGFRPERGCKDALREVDRNLKEGYPYVVDADLQGYLDSIPHTELMQSVAR